MGIYEMGVWAFRDLYNDVVVADSTLHPSFGCVSRFPGPYIGHLEESHLGQPSCCNLDQCFIPSTDTLNGTSDLRPVESPLTQRLRACN